MTRRLIPLIAVVPFGVAVGLLSSSQDWSTPTRLLVLAVATLVIVAVGTPFALRARRVPLPASGQSGIPGWRLDGVFSEESVDPSPLPARLVTGVRSTDATVLLPVVPDITLDRGRTIKRVYVIPPKESASYFAQLDDVPYDLALWPERGRRRPLRWLPLRAYLRLRSLKWGRRTDERSKDRSPATPSSDRLIDQAPA